MDQQTFEHLSGRLETDRYFGLKEFSEKNRPVVSAYLLGALHAGEILTLKYQNSRYKIKYSEGGLIDETEGKEIDFHRLSEMLSDGAIVRFNE